MLPCDEWGHQVKGTWEQESREGFQQQEKHGGTLRGWNLYLSGV